MKNRMSIMKNTIKLGVIGSGWMADMFCTEGKNVKNVNIAAVFSRNPQRAAAFAQKHGIPAFTADLDELLAGDLDAVYIAATNDRHCALTLRALRSRKAVLLEKPFALNSDETLLIIKEAAARGVLVMEAMWLRFFPSVLAMKRLADDGMIGNLRSVTVPCSLLLDRQKNARVFDPRLGGGVLADIGVYALSFVQMLAGHKPVLVRNRAALDRETGVDLRDDILLKYNSGFEARITVSGEEELPPLLEVVGSRGSLICEEGLFSGKFAVRTPEGRFDYNFAAERFRYYYAYELEHFARCLLEGRRESYIVPLRDTLHVMQILDACRRMAGCADPQETELERHSAV